MTEFYHCDPCEFEECECGGGFYFHDDEVEPECPCCGSEEVNP